jgi:hypothetical protein
MDLITDLPETPDGHDSVVVIVDRLSKMTHMAPCTKTISSTKLAALFAREVTRLHGFQKSIVMDRDPRFTGQFWQDVCKLFGTRVRLSTAFHPQSDGQTERMNRLVEDVLRHYISPTQKDWDKQLMPVEFAINNAPQSSTGMSPFMLNAGQHPLTPLAMDMDDCKSQSASEFVGQMQTNLQLAKQMIQAAQDRQKATADGRRRDYAFVPGDWVMLSTKNIKLRMTGAKKLMPLWCGPFKVIDLVGPVAYQLELPDSLSRMHNVFHVSLLKLYHFSDRVELPPPPVLNDDSELEFEVDTILAHRDRKCGKGQRREYLIKWQGYPPEHNTWEPEANMTNCRELLGEYWRAENQKNISEQTKGSAAAPRPTRNIRSRR